MSTPKQFKLNIEGTRYEASDSLPNRYQDSMLRRLTSDAWNAIDGSSYPDEMNEIFIESYGERFIFILKITCGMRKFFFHCLFLVYN